MNPFFYKDDYGQVVHLININKKDFSTKICDEVLPPAIKTNVIMLTISAFSNNKYILDKK